MKHETKHEAMILEQQRESKIARLCDMVLSANDEQTDLDKLVALSMKTGYELAKQAQQ